MTPAQLLEEVGHALFGHSDGWKAQMAHELGVSPGRIDDWLKGRNHPQEGVWLDLHAALQERARTLPSLKPGLLAAAGLAGLRPKLINLQGLHVVHDGDVEVFRGSYDEWLHWLAIQQGKAITRAMAERVGIPLSEDELECLRLDDEAEGARRDWLAAGRQRTNIFANGPRGGPPPSPDQLEEVERLEQKYRELHARRLAAHERLFERQDPR